MELRANRRKRSLGELGPRKNGQDTVGWYLQHVADAEVLDHASVVELFKRMEAGDKRAKNEIVSHNLKLVVSIAKAYRDKGVDFQDLLQEGNLGLIRAVEKFDWKRGHRFSTYATWWIRQHVSHYLATQRYSIRVPTHAMRMRKHIEKAMKEYKDLHGSEPTWEELAAVVQSSPDVVEATILGSKPTISLSVPRHRGDATGGSLEDTLQDETESPFDKLSKEQLCDVVAGAIDSLEDLDREILRLRMQPAVDEELDGQDTAEGTEE